MPGQHHGQRLANPIPVLRHPTPISARTSPTSSAAPNTPQETSMTTPTLYTASPSPQSVTGGKVRMVRQWAPRTEMWAGTAQV